MYLIIISNLEFNIPKDPHYPWWTSKIPCPSLHDLLCVGARDLESHSNAKVRAWRSQWVGLISNKIAYICLKLEAIHKSQVSANLACAEEETIPRHSSFKKLRRHLGRHVNKYLYSYTILKVFMCQLCTKFFFCVFEDLYFNVGTTYWVPNWH